MNLRCKPYFHGRLMFCATPCRLALLGIAACCLADGCGRGVATSQRDASQPPRVLQLPDHVQPLPADDAGSDAADDTRSVPAQYQQPQAAVAAQAPRIVELAAPTRPAAGPIREPAPAEITEPSAAPPQRSEFVPIAMPDPSSPPPQASLPDLPPAAAFSAIQPPATASSTVQTPSGEGPQLASPTASAAQPALPPATAEANRTFAPTLSSNEMLVPAPAPPAATPAAPTASPAIQNSAAMQVVAQRAMHKADHAAAMAQRGMLYSARTELIQALQLIAQALDVERGGTQHAAALSAGLTALAEARDFSAGAAHPGEAVDVSAIAASHRTPLLQKAAALPISPVVAQQQYFAQAQALLTTAAGGVPAGSQILYRLGRLQTAMAAHDPDPLALHAPQAIVFHQAAMATDEKNWLAANELGVLYARYGQLAEARQLLAHSVTVHPHVEGWHNLATVHGRLGETDLARRAEHERQVLAQQSGQSPAEASGMVRWVDTQTFAAAGGSDVRWPADAAGGKSVAATPGLPRR